MDSWSPKVVTLDDLAKEMLPKDLVDAIDQMFLEEMPLEGGEQDNRFLQLIAKPLALKPWIPELPSEKKSDPKGRVNLN